MIKFDFSAEPPLTGVTNFNAVAEFTTVALTWDEVEGATNYNVAWRPAGASDWTAVSFFSLLRLVIRRKFHESKRDIYR